MVTYNIISADTHIIEPPDIYEDRIDRRKFGERVPRIKRRRNAQGAEYDAWFIGDVQVGALGAVTTAGQRFDDPSQIDRPTTWEQVRRGVYDPHAMLQELEADGIWGAVVQPSQGLFWYHMEDSELLSALCHAFNEWMAEFCKPYPDRLKGIGMVNVDDVPGACKELERCATLGLAGSFIPVTPLPGAPYRQPLYEPLWRTAESLEVPLLMHLSTQRAGVSDEIDISGMASGKVRPAAMRPTQDYWVRYALADMVFAGVFERYPKLCVGSVEHEISWAPHWLRNMDYTYRERPQYVGYKSREGLLPSDYWRRNMFAVFTEDDVGVRVRDVIGVDNMLWGNDFPHSESTWPRSRHFLETFFAGVSEQDRRKVTHDNAARIFHFAG